MKDSNTTKEQYILKTIKNIIDSPLSERATVDAIDVIVRTALSEYKNAKDENDE